MHCVLDVFRRTGGMADNTEPGRYQLYRTDRQWFSGHADGDQLTLGQNPTARAAHRRGIPVGGQDDRRSAQRSQSFGDVAGGGVDVVMGPKFASILGFGRTAGDRNGLEAHRPGELHTEVAEPTNAENRDPVTRERLGVAQRVVGCDTRTAHRGGFYIGELGRYPRQRICRHRHRLRVSAGVVQARNLSVRAVDEDAFAAGVAAVAVSPEPTDRHAIAAREIIDTRTEFGYRPSDFMSKGQWPRHVRKAAADEGAVGATYPAGGDRQPYLIAARWRRFNVDQLQGCARGLYVDSSMCRHGLNIGPSE